MANSIKTYVQYDPDSRETKKKPPEEETDLGLLEKEASLWVYATGQENSSDV